MKKGTAKAMRYIVAGSALTLCVIMTGCGCGQKKTDPASEQVLKISITPEPSGTGYGRCGSSYFEWRYQYGESVSGRKSISGDKQYRYGCG